MARNLKGAAVPADVSKQNALQIFNLKKQLADEKAMRKLAEDERDQFMQMVADAEIAIRVQARILNGARTLRPDERVPF
jgi:hypothetical protein